jgi:hypothetical protein
VSRRLKLKQSPGVERVEEKCLLSTVLPGSALAEPVLPQVSVAPAPLHATDAPGVAGPALHVLCHGHRLRSSQFNLVAVNNSLATPVGRVQVDNVPLQNGKTYPLMSILGVMNATGRDIGRNSFSVNIPGSSFHRSFPEQVWRPGQVLAFFSTTSAAQFQFHLGGSPVSINPNNFPNVTYQSSTFNTTLGNLINTPAFGGRFQLVSHA